LGSAVVGYNVQTAVDAKHHLIVAHEVTNSVTDRGQLAALAKAAKKAFAHPHPTVLADRGYFEGYEILKCERAGIATMVPKPLTSNSKFEGRFDKRNFNCDAHSDTYRPSRVKVQFLLASPCQETWSTCLTRLRATGRRVRCSTICVRGLTVPSFRIIVALLGVDGGGGGGGGDR
jgi:hypothetical protein